MMTGIGPTIGNPRPGYGIRVRLDNYKALSLASGDFVCPCGLAVDAVGYAETEHLVVRAQRHRRDECPIPEIREQAAAEASRLQVGTDG